MTEQYVLPPRSFRLILNYLKRVGLVQVVRKVRSRVSEARRNRKVSAIGVGLAIEVPDTMEGGVRVGDFVLFYAPSINPDASRAVIDVDLALRIDGLLSPEGARPSAALAEMAGWSHYSGAAFNKDRVRSDLSALAKRLRATNDGQAAQVPLAHIAEQAIDISKRRSGRSTAVIFGLGHYAKHIIVPNLPRAFAIEAVHEIDPDQLESWPRAVRRRDTAPFPRDDEHYDLWLIAGFHHTHSDIAVEAMRRGGAVAVEKPIATTREGLSSIEALVSESASNRFFACFHRRYVAYNAWIRADLELEPGMPVHYNCISYDIPISRHHWYSWPNSRSRMISNGCHWIDHFMLLNDYSPVVAHTAVRGVGQNCLGWLRLANGAEMSLHLSEIGGSPFGVRDHVEVSVEGRTAIVSDSALYTAVDKLRTIRRIRVNPLSAYRAMYREIGRKVLLGEPGDSLITLRSSAAAIELDRLLEQQPPT
ncbi:Gfo/Idh/MocA family oxidoreductase [Sphingomonas sp. HF-S4]|uniref:Gfo/Idh/MocA family oxidoreductase n=1 Tax=Sphingomonas agrestis TaxID=3080540 RepID=A0ABU3Y5Y7_9SPHN|nr:Gfo/Idh/MocA family oxidoreductase [Sphingomonas sp. HF-S4]MDV3456814.1 Gfo/Idh/MocA family oxidoreductase [Sphingomonas sp. HF-S4]